MDRSSGLIEPIADVNGILKRLVAPGTDESARRLVRMRYDTVSIRVSAEGWGRS